MRRFCSPIVLYLLFAIQAIIYIFAVRMKKRLSQFSRLLVLMLVLSSILGNAVAKGFSSTTAQCKEVVTAKSKKRSKSATEKEGNQQQVVIATAHALSLASLPSPDFAAVIPSSLQELFYCAFSKPKAIIAQVKSIFQLCFYSNLFFTSIQRSAP